MGVFCRQGESHCDPANRMPPKVHDTGVDRMNFCFSFSSISVTYHFSCFSCTALLDFSSENEALSDFTCTYVCIDSTHIKQLFLFLEFSGFLYTPTAHELFLMVASTVWVKNG